MGFYIDPQNCSKEQFLANKGRRIPVEDAYAVFDAGTNLPVCLVDNTIFTAAGIGFSKREIDAFNHPDDRCPKQWFSVKREDLVEFYPDALAEASE